MAARTAGSASRPAVGAASRISAVDPTVTSENSAKASRCSREPPASPGNVQVRAARSPGANRPPARMTGTTTRLPDIAAGSMLRVSSAAARAAVAS